MHTTPFTYCLALSLLVTASLGAQAAPHRTAPSHPDTTGTAAVDTPDTDEEGVPLGLQFGVASGALHYGAGRSEQSLGAVVRWAPLRWLSLSATPTGLHQSTPAIGTTVAESRSGLVDLPVDVNVSHGFAALPFAPTLSAGVGATLPVGDTASGFGTGSVGYSVSGGLGFAPLPRLWVHLGAGHSLSDFSVQSALTAASGWGDASAGVAVTDRLSLSGGYSSDLGAADSTIGRSTSVNGGLAFAIRGPVTLNVSGSHGLGGAAPAWSFAMGVGTAFPYLSHLGSGSLTGMLQETFGGGTHGLGNGTGAGKGVGNGKGSSGSTTHGNSGGRGRGRP